MKNFKIKTIFGSAEGPKARANKIRTYQFYDFYFNIPGKLSVIRCYN